MSDLHRTLAAIAVRHLGIVTRRAAEEAGLDRRQVDRAIAAGILLPLHPGVFRHAAVPLTKQARWLAAVIAAGEGSYLSHRAGAVHLGFDGILRVRPELTAPYSRLPLLEGATVHRTRKLDPLDRMVKDGIPVSTPARTVLDLCAVLPYHLLEHTTQDAVIRKLVDPGDVYAVLERSGGKGKTGVTTCRELLLGGLPDPGIQSRLELLLAGILDVARVPRFVRQHPLTCVDGREVVLDNALPDVRVTVEADGLRWHGTSAQVRRTRARSRSIQASGWLHLVYGWSDCRETPQATRAEIEQVVWERLRRAS